jgi:serine/threonine protein kinase
MMAEPLSNPPCTNSPAEALLSSSDTQKAEIAAEDPTLLAVGPPPAAARLSGIPEQFGRYRILKTLGKGGMGTVYLAHDKHLDRKVALKVPTFSSEEDPTILERFYREARAAASLLHQNLCPLYDVGEVNGTPYLTMGYIEGKPLSEVLKHGTPPTPRQAAVLVRKIALALEEAHRANVIHRDLKPANIMMNMRGEPVVMDFGLARRTVAHEARMTQAGRAMGTPAYMSPEQACGDVNRMGPPSDIFSLGSILYELLAGEVPFKGSSLIVLAQVVTDEPMSIRGLRPEVDSRLEAICNKAMAKEISRRYASMAEFAEALERYLRQDSRAQQKPSVAAANDLPITEDRDESWNTSAVMIKPFQQPAAATFPRHSSAPAISRGRVWIGIVAGMVVIGAIVIGLLFKKHGADQEHDNKNDGALPAKSE